MTLSITSVLFGSTALVYLAASVLFVRQLAGRPLGDAGLAPRLVAVGAALHATDIVASSVIWRVCPVQGIHFAMSVVSMIMCVVYSLMRRSYRIDIVGSFVAPMALTSLLASKVVAATEPLIDSTSGINTSLLSVHILTNVLGVALFSLACAAAVAYLVQERLLKKKRVEGLVTRLPPLDALDRAEHRFLLAGFPLLTIGIVIGSVWAKHVEHGGAAEIARAILSYLTWVLAAMVLLLRAAAGWRGRRAAYGTIAGFGVAVIVLILYMLRGLSGGRIA